MRCLRQIQQVLVSENESISECDQMQACLPRHRCVQLHKPTSASMAMVSGPERRLLGILEGLKGKFWPLVGVQS